MLSTLQPKLKIFLKNKWAFPVILFLVVIVLSLLRIHGSSIGMYHNFFYGEHIKDSNLIANKPQAIRSDEWLVSSQLTLAQTENDFNEVNHNLGTGIDVSMVVDAPTKSVIQLFKPHNFGFFVLPKDVAFAFKWWIIAYLLVVSIYLFVLVVLPGRIKLAILLSLGFAMSPFFVWWYQSGTLATIYFAIFGLIVALKIINAKNWKHSFAWGILLSYIATSFALVLYPPFQIPVILVVLAFLVGYSIDHKKIFKKNLKNIFIGVLTTGILTLAWLVLALVPKISIIEAISKTDYPGERITTSGFSMAHEAILFVAGNISPLLQSQSRTNALSWAPNQSEAATFYMIGLLLLPSILYFVIRYKKRLTNYWTIMSMVSVLTIFLVWTFIPGLDFLGIITFLNRVPHGRMLIGVGLASFIVLVLGISVFQNKFIKLSKPFPVLYSGSIFIIYLFINMLISYFSPEFMGAKWAIVLAIPYAVIIYLILDKKFILGATALLLFSLGSIMFVHPIYRGVDIITNSEISRAMNELDPNGDSVWVVDNLTFENLALVNNKKSLTGTYLYPDFNVWERYFAKDKIKYNRYAHVVADLDRNETDEIETTLINPQEDILVVSTEVCSVFFEDAGVNYILTQTPITSLQAPCLELTRVIKMPATTFYVYKVD